MNNGKSIMNHAGIMIIPIVPRDKKGLPHFFVCGRPVSVDPSEKLSADRLPDQPENYRSAVS
jgi:hypothetical protein